MSDDRHCGILLLLLLAHRPHVGLGLGNAAQDGVENLPIEEPAANGFLKAMMMSGMSKCTYCPLGSYRELIVILLEE